MQQMENVVIQFAAEWSDVCEPFPVVSCALQGGNERGLYGYGFGSRLGSLLYAIDGGVPVGGYLKWVACRVGFG